METKAIEAAVVMLAVFGVIGLTLALVWRNRPFRVGAGLLTLGVVLWMAGVLLVMFQARHLRQYEVLHTWRTAPGVITESRVIGEKAARPEVVYRYTVDGQTYKDSTSLNPPNFGGRNAQQEAASGIANEYPVGKQVVIHYDPAQPSRSRLKITPPWDVYGQLGFGGFLFGLGLFLAVAYFSPRHPRPIQPKS